MSVTNQMSMLKPSLARSYSSSK